MTLLSQRIQAQKENLQNLCFVQGQMFNSQEGKDKTLCMLLEALLSCRTCLLSIVVAPKSPLSHCH